MEITHIPINITVQKIETIVRNMMNFWKSSEGWAPLSAANLLNKSMLEWQTSLASCLHHWTRPLSDGELILAWANIGSLVEGQLKLLLSVYYHDYASDVDSIKSKDGALVDPDSMTLEPLRIFFHKKIWDSSDSWNEWILHIQQRRNAIHAFKYKEIGTTAELHMALERLLEFIHVINSRLPYPNEMYRPRDC